MLTKFLLLGREAMSDTPISHLAATYSSEYMCNVVPLHVAYSLECELHVLKKEYAELRNALQTLVYRYRSAPDGPLGRGLTNGAFLRAEQLLREKP